MENKKLSLKEIGIKKLLVILIAGIVLIVFSVSDLFTTPEDKDKQEKSLKKENIEESIITDSVPDEGYYEKKLTYMLESIRGVGSVRVMITYSDKGEKSILKDYQTVTEELSETDSSGGTRSTQNKETKTETVRVDNGTGKEAPYVSKEAPPTVAGVLIVAEGASNKKISSEIVAAVEALFGIPVHKIQVMEMN